MTNDGDGDDDRCYPSIYLEQCSYEEMKNKKEYHGHKKKKKKIVHSNLTIKAQVMNVMIHEPAKKYSE